MYQVKETVEIRNSNKTSFENAEKAIEADKRKVHVQTLSYSTAA